MAGSDALLFSVFLLLAGFMAALVAKTPTDPPRTATVLSSPAERAGGLPSPLSTNTTTALSRLEKLRTTWPRRRVPQDAVQSLTAIGSFSLRAEDPVLADPFALQLANGDPPGDRKTAVLLDLLLRVAPSLTELTVVWPATGSETFPMALERAESLKQRLRATGLRLPLRSEIAPQPGWRPQLRLALGRS